MNGGPTAADLALLVTTPPYARRDARAELDVALAAAALDRRLELYFLGAGLLQLVRDRDPRPAALPAGYRGWATLPGLAEVAMFADADDLRRLDRLGLEPALPVIPLGAAELAQRWRGAAHAMVL